MRINLTRLLIIAGIIGLIAVHDVNAQKRVGAGFAWGSEIDDVGINFNGEIFFKGALAIAPKFTYYFVGSNVTFWELNGDVHYYFQGGDSGVYGFGGVNISHQKVSILGFSASDSEFGLNLGAGYSIGLSGPIVPFGEIKYIISNFDQLVLTAGVRFGL